MWRRDTWHWWGSWPFRLTCTGESPQRDCDFSRASVISGTASARKPGAIVTVSFLPPSPSALAQSSWEDIAPYFDELAGRPLDADSIEGWLREWSRLEELVTEAAARAMIAYTIETSDPRKEADHLRFSTEILPRMEE